ncbi:3Beta_HSD domain-containing protein [Cephalotus follicularis]|uniref:3Beta_HSD domain-containing protein n=1 Tax=Cephalotus follicularis TaxID=3775 RepID=A0A1Q3C328_CEPFO|nr:3Beta_HSD domain-containing protein [Cephalotus follicularis]
MGIVRIEERRRLEIEEFRRMLVACAGLNRRKDEEEDLHGGISSTNTSCIDFAQDKVVCVTSGVSFLGLALVNRLLLRGYKVRIIVDNQEDIEKLREMETSGEMRITNNRFKAVMAKLMEVQSLSEAFEGCCGVFHTSSFADPAGLSGYTKSMAEIEVKASENVMKACARTPSVRNCVLTSSLLACIWRDSNLHELSRVVNHECWSDESLCIDKKLWYAFGKLKAEKAAWRIAEEEGLKLTTICPGLITGPEFVHRNSTATIAYIKGAREMYADALLATVDLSKLAYAHVCVFEEMNKTAFGRYICFDHVIEGDDEAEKLAHEVGIPADKICGNASGYIPTGFELSNRKLTCLMSRTLGSCYNEI